MMPDPLQLIVVPSHCTIPGALLLPSGAAPPFMFKSTGGAMMPTANGVIPFGIIPLSTKAALERASPMNPATGAVSYTLQGVVVEQFVNAPVSVL